MSFFNQPNSSILNFDIIRITPGVGRRSSAEMEFNNIDKCNRQTQSKGRLRPSHV